MSYRVVFIPRFDGDEEYSFSQTYLTKDQAETALDAIANYTLMLHETSLMDDYSNMGLVEQFIDGEWIEIDEDGNFI